MKSSDNAPGAKPEIEYMPVSAFTHAFGIGTTKTYELIGNGTLRSITVGKRRLINVAAAREHFRSQECGR